MVNSNIESKPSSSYPFSDEVPELLIKHLDQLKTSAISIDVVKERGYKSVLGKTALREVGFGKAQQRAPGILMSLHSVDGSSIGCQYRPDYPRFNTKGKPIKYENPTGSSIRLDVPPRCKPMLGDPSIPIFFVEGVKKADALTSQGACAVALNGIWGFRGKNPLGGITIQSDFDYIALNGRQAYVVYDSDVAINPQVRKAQGRLLEHLRRRGANSRAIYLPPKPDGGKQGVDDFLAAGHTLNDVIALVAMPDEEATQIRRSEYIIETEDGKLKLDLAKLVEDLLAEYHFLTMRDTEEILIYYDGVWKFGGEAFIKQECQRRVTITELLTKYKIGEIIGHIQRSTYCDRKIFTKEKWIINLKNGLLDINSGRLRPHTHEFLSTVRIPVEYNPDADCPRVKKFFSEVLRTEDIPTIEEFFGYCLISDYTMQAIPLFVGEGGEGKSKTINLLEEFIGKDNCSHIPWHELERSRFAKAVLVGKLVNSFADLPSKSITETGTLKMLTGGDSMEAEKKFRDHVSFTNFARLIFSTNKPPIVSDDSYAFWRRWIIINFPNQFIGEKEDKQILTKITTKDELSGLLNLALIGLKRLMENQDYSYTKTVEETTEIYLRAADPIYAFLEDEYEVDSKGWISKDELYQYYEEYCQTKNIPLKKPNSFARGLQNQIYFRISSVRQTKEGSQVPGWQGIKKREHSEDSKVFPYLNAGKEKQCNSSSNRLKYRKNVTNLTNPATSPAKTTPAPALAEKDRPPSDNLAPPYPTESCYTCGSPDYWLSPGNEWLCCRCHPKPSMALPTTGEVDFIPLNIDSFRTGGRHNG